MVRWCNWRAKNAKKRSEGREGKDIHFESKGTGSLGRKAAAGFGQTKDVLQGTEEGKM